MKNKSVYNPEKELTDEEISKLSEGELFEYLDSKAEYLKQFSAPLDTYHAKQFASLSKGEVLSDEELKLAKDVGKIGDDERANRIAEASSKKGGDPLYRDIKVKNVKRNRKQWFD